MAETVNTLFDSDATEYECTSTLTNEVKVSEKVKQTELKPCPFCGGKAEIKKGKVHLFGDYYLLRKYPKPTRKFSIYILAKIKEN